MPSLTALPLLVRDRQVSILLQQNRFRQLLIANVVGKLGTSIAPLALAFGVFANGGSGLLLGLILAANTLPSLVFLLLGGILADRISRSIIIFWGRTTSSLSYVCLGFIFLYGAPKSTALIALGAISGIADSFTIPASSGIVKQLVAPEYLQKANALIRLPSNAIKVIGPVLGGIVVGVVGSGPTLLWTALCLLFSAILFRRLRITSKVDRESSALEDLSVGWAEFRKRTWLWTYTLSGTIIVAFWLAGFQLLGPLAAARYYGGAKSWGIVEGSLAIGLLLGTVVSLRWKPSALLVVSLAGSFGLSFPLVLIGLKTPLFFVAAGTIVTGVALDISIVAWVTVMQQHLQDEVLGRLSSFNSLGELAAIPIAYLVVGIASKTLNIDWLLIISAAIIAATTLANLMVPDVHRVRRLH